MLSEQRDSVRLLRRAVLADQRKCRLLEICLAGKLSDAKCDRQHMIFLNYESVHAARKIVVENMLTCIGTFIGYLAVAKPLFIL